MKKKRVLIVYYSFSGQTQVLMQRLAAGLRENDLDVATERLQPVEQIVFPFSSWLTMSKVMVSSFFRKRVPIRPIEQAKNERWDLIILAGPTWSYNPSGPVLDFIDRYGQQLLARNRVLPIISCRSYWRTHYWGLRAILKGDGATVLEPRIYLHSAAEPWRTVGLFLQLVGRLPRKESSWFRKRYERYGHSKAQYDEALDLGRKIGRQIADEGI